MIELQGAAESRIFSLRHAGHINPINPGEVLPQRIFSMNVCYRLGSSGRSWADKPSSVRLSLVRVLLDRDQTDQAAVGHFGWAPVCCPRSILIKFFVKLSLGVLRLAFFLSPP